MELLASIAVGGFVALSCMVVTGLRRAHHMMSWKADTGMASEAPSVSVCIPARNEAHALSACLDRVLESDYEKLEILVLDDESIDQTPTLIKSFAHAGVRFIAGKRLPHGWIGKNHALDTLAREASGDIIVFADVDVHLSPQSISHIVASMTPQTHVLSIIPARHNTYRVSALFGHLRYLWDLMAVGLGGKSASASLWVVRREWLLESFHGLENVREMIRPELAVVLRGTTRSQLLLGGEMGVGYEKHWHSQVESSERLLVPTFRQLGLRAIAVAFWLLLGVVAVVTAAAFLFIQPSVVSLVLFYGAFITGYITAYAYLRSVWQTRAWLGAMLWCWMVSQELLLIVISLVRYVTKSVTWKGRSIHAQPNNDDYLSV